MGVRNRSSTSASGETLSPSLPFSPMITATFYWLCCSGLTDNVHRQVVLWIKAIQQASHYTTKPVCGHPISGYDCIHVRLDNMLLRLQVEGSNASTTIYKTAFFDPVVKQEATAPFRKWTWQREIAPAGEWTQTSGLPGASHQKKLTESSSIAARIQTWASQSPPQRDDPVWIPATAKEFVSFF